MSLNKFTSAISGGLARKNRYRVTLTGQGPALAGGFTDHLSLMCESIEFPGQNLMSDPDVLRNGPPREMVTQATYGSVNATFICSSDMREKKWFEQWQENVISMTSWEPGFYYNYVGDMTIHQLDRGLEIPRYTIEVFEVYPKTINAQSAGNAENDSYHTVEVEFMFHRWVRSDTQVSAAGMVDDFSAMPSNQKNAAGAQHDSNNPSTVRTNPHQVDDFSSMPSKGFVDQSRSLHHGAHNRLNQKGA